MPLLANRRAHRPGRCGSIAMAFRIRTAGWPPCGSKRRNRPKARRGGEMMRIALAAGMLLATVQAAQAQRAARGDQGAPPPIVLPVTPPPVLAMPAPKPPMPPVAVTKPKPLTNPGTWFSPEDYPIPALMNDAEGQVVFSVHVSKTGVPVDCQVTYTASPFLGAPTCALAMERGQFAPG